MTQFETRLKEVSHFFENNDTVLGYRKFLDCAIDTQNMDIYKDVVALTEWKSANPNDLEVLKQKVGNTLEKISKFPIEEVSTATPFLSARDISKSYGHNRFSLGPVSVDIRKREVYGLVGENGNGKTTLLRILAKELKHDSGNIQYGFESTSPSDFDLRTKLVYIPQRTQKWYGSLKDNLKFVLTNYGIAPEENELRTLMMIARFGLWDYKHLKWSELSSGYKMRFELARTMLRQPEVLLLDEPLANLDVLAQQVILEDLKSICSSLNNPVALILSSQQLYEVEKISDNVIFLKNGQYTDNTHSKESSGQLIVELDCKAERAELQQIFSPLKLEKLTFNGGLYVAYFSDETAFASVLETLGKHNIEVTYTRNITASTRRFFVS